MKIVVFAYACSPTAGSEDGAGWIWARMLASFGDVWIITRANNRDLIERGLEGLAEADRLHFVYLDLPARWRTWKRRQRGIRLYYFLWQILAVREARRLHRTVDFDLSWHATFANAWLGSLAPFIGLPFVYGPVGGGIGLRWRLLPMLGWWGASYEIARGIARTSARYLNPVARLAWSRATLILGQNPEFIAWLPRRHRHKARVFPNVSLEPAQGHRSVRPANAEANVVVFAARLLPMKGAAFAIRAIAIRPGWRLVICGEGREEATLRTLAASLGVEKSVEFRGWVERTALHRLLETEADVFLFPSLHDEAGWSVVEAMQRAVPVVCFDVGGPPVLVGDAGIAVPACGSIEEISSRLRAALDESLSPGAAGRAEARGEWFSRDAVQERLSSTLRETVAQVGRVGRAA